MKTKVLLADDHKIFREGLRLLIEKESELEFAGETDNGRIAIKMVCDLKPDVVIMDIGMPDMNGIEATRQIMAKVPDTKVIALSIHSDKRFVSEMLKAGACGYLLKDSAFEELVTAILTVISNRMYLSPIITDVAIHDYISLMTQEKKLVYSSLTPREREVLKLIANGINTKQIAAELCISTKTIEAHRQSVMEKLDIHNLVDLTKYAIRIGLTSLD
jgi:DNA-binding NarL/FixJ family response regulator